MKRRVSRKINWWCIIIHLIRVAFLYTLIVILGILLEINIILITIVFSVFVFSMLLADIVNKRYLIEQDNKEISKKENSNGNN